MRTHPNVVVAQSCCGDGSLEAPRQYQEVAPTARIGVLTPASTLVYSKGAPGGGFHPKPPLRAIRKANPTS